MPPIEGDGSANTRDPHVNQLKSLGSSVKLEQGQCPAPVKTEPISPAIGDAAGSAQVPVSANALYAMRRSSSATSLERSASRFQHAARTPLDTRPDAEMRGATGDCASNPVAIEDGSDDDEAKDAPDAVAEARAPGACAEADRPEHAGAKSEGASKTDVSLPDKLKNGRRKILEQKRIEREAQKLKEREAHARAEGASAHKGASKKPAASKRTVQAKTAKVMVPMELSEVGKTIQMDDVWKELRRLVSLKKGRPTQGSLTSRAYDTCKRRGLAMNLPKEVVVDAAKFHYREAVKLFKSTSCS